jgi:hypothetical protein
MISMLAELIRMFGELAGYICVLGIGLFAFVLVFTAITDRYEINR